MSQNKSITTCAPNPGTVLSQQSVALKDAVREVVRAKPGQPTNYTPEAWEAICHRVACGESLLSVCQEPGMPSYSTVRAWWTRMPELKRDLEAAWEDSTYLNHAINTDILREGPLSTGDFRRDEALVKLNNWTASKTNKRVFGDKVQVDVVQHQPVIIDWNIIEGEGGDGV